jgi:ribosomal protein S12 methylthiotransferase
MDTVTSAAVSAPTPKASVFFRSLGCPKNQLDSEVMLAGLALDDFVVAERLEDADVAIVNTCSFIESAREESVEAILEVAALRETGRLRALLVTGCMPQRYGDELARELPEVDAFIGTSEYPRAPAILDDVLAGRVPRGGIYVEARRAHLYDHTTPRLLIGGGHSAYVKTSEGCDRTCAFCAIPGIRGRFQSRTLESLVAEAEALAAQGVLELNLVAQDQTSWGKDLPGRPRLPELLRALDRVRGLRWIRVLYLYPTAVTDELIEVLAGAERVLPYVDVPLQHASDRVLRAMRRGTSAQRQRRLVERLRAGIPDLTLRTTFIVGFPGERESDFEALLDFVREARFDRVGVFRYSDEEGTAAFALPGKVPRAVARERHRRLLGLQAGIMAETLAAWVGREAELLVDRAGPHGAEARLPSQAPEIDGGVVLRGPARPGEWVRARITGVRKGVDLEAERL